MAQKDKIKIIRLITGEDILAEIIDDDFVTRDKLAIKNPVRVVVVPSRADPSMPQVGFAPYCEFSKQEDFYLFRSAIVTIIDPINEFLDQYNGLFSKIIQPSAATQTTGRLIGI